jgi:hypothetical protein
MQRKGSPCRHFDRCVQTEGLAAVLNQGRPGSNDAAVVKSMR